MVREEMDWLSDGAVEPDIMMDAFEVAPLDRSYFIEQCVGATTSNVSSTLMSRLTPERQNVCVTVCQEDRH